MQRSSGPGAGVRAQGATTLRRAFCSSALPSHPRTRSRADATCARPTANPLTAPAPTSLRRHMRHASRLSPALAAPSPTSPPAPTAPTTPTSPTTLTFLSVFDIFKIGVGPSSSHTMGPMVAAARFVAMMRDSPHAHAFTAIQVSLYGSLAFTGLGHATDRAVLLGLTGMLPDKYDAVRADALLRDATRAPAARPSSNGNGNGSGSPPSMRTRATITPPGLQPLPVDVIFDFGPPLPGHANGLVLRALGPAGEVQLQETFYSIGGGFVLTAEEHALGASMDDAGEAALLPYPYPYTTADQMIIMSTASGKSVAEMQRANELVHIARLRLRANPGTSASAASVSDLEQAAAGAEEELDAGLARVWGAMRSCIERGLGTGGMLPGGLQVTRRAPSIHSALVAERELSQQPGGTLPAPHTVNDWISAYAMAVNEENAAGGQVVTAPTNGAAGVVPAVLYYFLNHVPFPAARGPSSSLPPGPAPAPRRIVSDFLLTAAAVGAVVKQNASISGAECGCQAEIGSAAAMAAAGMAAVLGGSCLQVENAAEIALEHHLGMTCDPIAGLVQVPCIERNGVGAIKAVSAASLALRGSGSHLVSLDVCIKTMLETGRDMSVRYKETSLGGLALMGGNMPHIPNC